MSNKRNKKKLSIWNLPKFKWVLLKTTRGRILVLAALILLTGAVSVYILAARHTPTTPSAKISHVASPSASSTSSPSPSASHTTKSTPSPTVVPAGAPYVDLHLNGLHNTEGEAIDTPNGSKYASVLVQLIPRNTTLSKCTLQDNVVIDDNNFTAETLNYPVVASQYISMIDGLHTVTVSCFDDGHAFSDMVKNRVVDGQPKLCAGFGYTDTPITVGSQQQLHDDMLGTWAGCVTNPWVVTYYITITFNSDGTVSTTSPETIDGIHEPALYWGDDLDNPNRKWDVTGIDGSDVGTGYADLYWQVSNTIRPLQLSNIKLMGDHLSFTGGYQYDSSDTYGPLNIQLIRQ